MPPDQVPPLAAVTEPDKVTVVFAQTDWSAPALAVIVYAKAVTTTESVAGGQLVVSLTVT